MVSNATQQQRPRTAPVVRRRFEMLHEQAQLAAGARPTVLREKREPPPWLVNAAAQPLRRSASLAGYMPHPPKECIRRRAPCVPVARPVLVVEEDSRLFTTSHKLHFMDKGLPRRRPACTPVAHKGLFSEIAEMGLPSLMRTTSAEHFQQRVVPVRLAAFVPPVNRAPYSSVDDPGSSVFRTTTASHFQQQIVPRRREQCRPKTSGGSLFAFEGAWLPRSTSHEAFQSLVVPKQRAPCLPPRSAAPYGSHTMY
jgi:hypothetical protein